MYHVQCSHILVQLCTQTVSPKMTEPWFKSLPIILSFADSFKFLNACCQNLDELRDSVKGDVANHLDN